MKAPDDFGDCPTPSHKKCYSLEYKAGIVDGEKKGYTAGLNNIMAILNKQIASVSFDHSIVVKCIIDMIEEETKND